MNKQSTIRIDGNTKLSIDKESLSVVTLEIVRNIIN